METLSKINQRIFLFSKTSFPSIQHVPLLDTNYFDITIDFSAYDYIIVTSKEVLRALDRIGEWKQLPIIAISQATAQYARTKGARVLDVAEGYGENLTALIASRYANLKALHPHAKIVAYDINAQLQKYKICVDSFIVYETYCAHSLTFILPDDAICIFTSPSSVNCFLKKHTFLATHKIVCIGKTTAKALPENQDFYLAKTTSVESAVQMAKTLLQMP